MRTTLCDLAITGCALTLITASVACSHDDGGGGASASTGGIGGGAGGSAGAAGGHGGTGAAGGGGSAASGGGAGDGGAGGHAGSAAGGAGAGGTSGSGGADQDRCAVGAPAVHVATTGSDDASCGDAAAACATIRHGIDRATAGDTVCVHAGTYNESWVALKSDTWLVSADGPGQATIFSGDRSAVRLTSIENAGISGFEVHGNWNQGEAGDGLIRVLDATHVVIRDVIAYDAPHDQDVVKVSGAVRDLLIEGVVAWNPALRAGGNYQEVIDIFGSNAVAGQPPPVGNVTVRGCWLFHVGGVGDWLIYSKINAEQILYENNVFGPSAGQGWGNAAVGIGTSEAGIPVATAPVVTHAIVRNNIFVGLKGDAAFTVSNSDDAWVYNNTFYNNTGPDLRSVIMFRGNSHPVGATHVFNNIFVDNNPSQSGATFFWVRDGLPSEWHMHHNLFHNNIAASDTPYVGDADSVYGQNPQLHAPAIPSTLGWSLARIAQIKAGFSLGASSPAIGAGVDAISQTGHPNWNPGVTNRREDYEGDSRSSSSAWDLGADEVP